MVGKIFKILLYIIIGIGVVIGLIIFSKNLKENQELKNGEEIFRQKLILFDEVKFADSYMTGLVINKSDKTILNITLIFRIRDKVKDMVYDETEGEVSVNIPPNQFRKFKEFVYLDSYGDNSRIEWSVKEVRAKD